MARCRPLAGLLLVSVIFVDGPPGTAAAFTNAEKIDVLRAVYAGTGILRRLSEQWGDTQPVPVRRICTFTVTHGTHQIPLPPWPKEPDWNKAKQRDMAWLETVTQAMNLSGELDERIRTMRRILMGPPFAGIRFDDAVPLFVTKYHCHHPAFVEGKGYVVIDWPALVKMDPTNLDGIVAHELGHVFGAPDEYPGNYPDGTPHCLTTQVAGPFDTVNTNCATIIPATDDGVPAVLNTDQVPCLMNHTTHNLCPNTPLYWGWRDEDRDGVLDLTAPATIELPERIAVTGKGFTILGPHMWDVRAVSVGNVWATEIIHNDTTPERLDIIVPPGVTGIVSVNVFTRAGACVSPWDDTWVHVSPEPPIPVPAGGPLVIGLVPAAGAPGTRVKVLGYRLGPVTQAVSFGSAPADLTGLPEYDDQLPEIVVPVPAHPTGGTVTVTVTTPRGVSPSFPPFTEFTYQATPTGTGGGQPGGQPGETGAAQPVGDHAAGTRSRLVSAMDRLHDPGPDTRRAALAEVLGVPGLEPGELLRRLTDLDTGQAPERPALWTALTRVMAAAAEQARPDWSLRVPGVVTAGPTGVTATGTTVPDPAELVFTLPALRLAGALDADSVILRLTLPTDPTTAALSFTVDRLRVRLPAGGLLNLMVPGAAVLEGRVAATVDAKGVRFTGGSSGGIDVPLSGVPHGVSAPSLNLAPLAAGDGIRLTASLGATLLGMAATLDGTGIEVRLPAPGAAPAVRPVPPAGAGLVVALGPARGAGYLRERPDGRYGGAFVLRMGIVDVAAFGLLRADPFSLLIVLSAHFTPPIELGLAFTLNAIGGVVGVNYAVDDDGLSAAVQSGHLDHLLFPADSASAAPQVVQTLASVFRERRGGALVGPMVRLGWGRPVSFLTADLGVILELHSGRTVILGRLRMALPAPQAPIVDLRAAFKGTIDAAGGRVQLDATLTGSRLALFAIDGGLAMRVEAGDRPMFLLSAGGFRDGFPVPADFPVPKRLTVPLADTPFLRIIFSGYVAITPGTLQIGAQLDVNVGTSSTGVSGSLGFDALMRWEPSFGVSLRAGGSFRLRVAGETLCSVSISVLVEGPTPCWHVAGRARVRIALATVTFPFDERWACTGQVTAPAAPDVASLLDKAVRDPRSWAPLPPLGAEPIVVLDSRREGLLHPLGRARFSQRVVPLGVPVTRFGPGRLPAATTFEVAVGFAAGGPEHTKEAREQFARADFFDLSDEQKLHEPAFEPLRSGAELVPPTPSTLAMPRESRRMEYETKWVGDGLSIGTRLADAAFVEAALAHNAVARSTIRDDDRAFARPEREPVLLPRAYATADTRTLAEDVTRPRRQTFTEAAAQLAAGAAQRDNLQLIPAHEVRP